MISNEIKEINMKWATKSNENRGNKCEIKK